MYPDAHARAHRLLTLSLSLVLVPVTNTRAVAQSVAPLVAEYTDRAEGSFEVNNTGDAAATVVLEPKSFTLNPDGSAQFRPLDPNIHLQLSTQSLRLEPHQTGRVFYKISADRLPAWLCIHSAFAPAARKPGPSVRIMLPHTVYLFQHQPLSKEAITVGRVWFDAGTHTVRAELSNESAMAGRAQRVEVFSAHGSATAGGFPMLPHSSRTLSIGWTDADAPQRVEVNFADFALKLPVDGGAAR